MAAADKPNSAGLEAYRAKAAAQQAAAEPVVAALSGLYRADRDRLLAYCQGLLDSAEARRVSAGLPHHSDIPWATCYWPTAEQRAEWAAVDQARRARVKARGVSESQRAYQRAWRARKRAERRESQTDTAQTGQPAQSGSQPGQVIDLETHRTAARQERQDQS